jgi:3-hydroxyacyl-[acyl-carrier-protein] dehydratase
MLQFDFFTMSALTREENSFKTQLALNAGHRIYGGHFPGRPVVPGACLMQMVKEITETITGNQLRLKRADYLKFIARIDPNEHNILQMVLKIQLKEEKEVSVSANLLNNSKTCFTFSGVFCPGS